MTTNWKIIISQRFSHRSEIPNPHMCLPSLRMWQQEEKSQKHLALRSRMASVQKFHRIGRETTFMEGMHRVSWTQTQHKEVTPLEPELELPMRFGRSLKWVDCDNL